MFTFGKKVVTFILMHIARLRSHELFTLTLLALTFMIAIVSALVFGTSIALGAFIAGMVIGQTHVKHQAAANALPMKDAFAVIFFLTVGMIFNPMAITENLTLFFGILTIVLIIKPLAAFLIAWVMRYPVKVALTVALALAQIGEFSFILGEEAIKFHLLPDEGYDIIVACALISISINPLLFKGVGFLQNSIEAIQHSYNPLIPNDVPPVFHALHAIIVGYGPLGRDVAASLEEQNFSLTVIDQNVDTIANLRNAQQKGVFGDASHPTILEDAHIEDADLLLITAPDLKTTLKIVQVARSLNPNIKILARANYMTDQQKLQDLQIESVCSEEETKQAFIKMVNHLLRDDLST
jgi:CPA2 family monovalent cation:H+ antiporter-2